MIAVLAVFAVVFLLFPASIQANNNYATIVNPVRISEYHSEPVESLKFQHEIVSSLNLPATWLLNFDVLQNEGIVKLVSEFGDSQEIGLFLEITKGLCDTSGVVYDSKFSWHHAANVFLTGYSQTDRLKLVDTAFNKFNEEFGYYPKSIGAWWIDIYSLEYIQEKYGAVANLGLADQFSTDGYQVWGTYWSAPFYPSNLHAGIPAQSIENKINIVTTQWAPRDPWNGYFNSYYSTQDYLQLPEKPNTNYFEKLIKLYALQNQNRFGHITVGLEGDLAKEAYSGEFRKQMELISQLKEKGEIEVINMKDFSSWYMETFVEVSPVHLIKSGNLVKEGNVTYWYNSPLYRLGLNYDRNESLLKIIDWRVYQDNFAEPYYASPNKDFNLRINIPSLIDHVSKGNEFEIDFGKILSEKYEDERLELVFESGQVILTREKIQITSKNIRLPQELIRNPMLRIAKYKSTYIFTPDTKYLYGQNGLTEKTLRKDLFDFMKFNLKNQPFKINEWVKGLVFKNYVSQAEIDALAYLKTFPFGRVLVYDNICWGCDWNTILKPAVFDNNRNYVGRLSSKKVIPNKTVFEAKDQKTAKEEFDKTRATYIYVTNYEGQIEKVPFSPGDLGVAKVYENANAQVWKRI